MVGQMIAGYRLFSPENTTVDPLFRPFFSFLEKANVKSKGL